MRNISRYFKNCVMIFLWYLEKKILWQIVSDLKKKKCNVWCILVGCIRLSTHATVFRSDNIRIHYITARNHLFTCYIIWKPGVISVQGISSYWSLIAKEKKLSDSGRIQHPINFHVHSEEIPHTANRLLIIKCY